MNFVKMLLSQIIILCLARQRCSDKKIQKAVSDNHFNSKLIATDKHDELLLVIYFVSQYNDEKNNQYVEQVASSYYPTTVFIEVDVTICRGTAGYFEVDEKSKFPKVIFRKSGVNIDRLDDFSKNKLINKIELYKDEADEQDNNQTAVSDKHFESKLRAIDKCDKLVVIYLIYRGDVKNQPDVEFVARHLSNIVIIKVDAVICTETKKKFAEDKEGETDIGAGYPRIVFRKSGVNVDRFDGLVQGELLTKIDLYKDDINKSYYDVKKIQTAKSDEHLESKLRALDKYDNLVVIYIIYRDDIENLPKVEYAANHFPNIVIIKVDAVICTKTIKIFAEDKERQTDIDAEYPVLIFRKSGVNVDRFNGSFQLELLNKIYKYQDVINESGSAKKIQTAVSDIHFESKLRAADKYDILVAIYFIYERRGEKLHEMVEKVANITPTIAFIKVDGQICTEAAENIAKDERNYILYPTLVFRKLGVNVYSSGGFIDENTFKKYISAYKDDINESPGTVQKALSDNHFKSKLIEADKNDELLLVIYFVYKNTGKEYYENVERVASSYTTSVMILVDADICKKTAKEFAINNKSESFPAFIFRKSGMTLDRFYGFIENELDYKINKYIDIVNPFSYEVIDEEVEEKEEDDDDVEL